MVPAASFSESGSHALHCRASRPRRGGARCRRLRRARVRHHRPGRGQGRRGRADLCRHLADGERRGGHLRAGPLEGAGLRAVRRRGAAGPRAGDAELSRGAAGRSAHGFPDGRGGAVSGRQGVSRRGQRQPRGRGRRGRGGSSSSCTGSTPTSPRGSIARRRCCTTSARRRSACTTPGRRRRTRGSISTTATARSSPATGWSGCSGSSARATPSGSSLVAHSMGAQVSLEALRQMALVGAPRFFDKLAGGGAALARRGRGPLPQRGRSARHDGHSLVHLRVEPRPGAQGFLVPARAEGAARLAGRSRRACRPRRDGHRHERRGRRGRAQPLGGGGLAGDDLAGAGARAATGRTSSSRTRPTSGWRRPPPTWCRA